MSPNGKYLIITLEKYIGEWESYYGIARYNTETDSVEVFLATEEDEEMPEVAYGIYGFAPVGTDESGEIKYFNDYGRTKYLAEEKYRGWLSSDKSNCLTIIRPTKLK